MAVLRLFVALYPPSEVAAALLASLPPQDVAPGRDTPPEQIHLTLHFIGDRSTRELPEVIESISRAASGLAAPECVCPELVALPAGQTARLIAARVEPHPTVLELHRRLTTRLARPGRKPDRFEPHLTLRRYPTTGGPRVARPIERVAFTPTQVELVRSVLSPSGASHETIHRVTLAVGG